MRACLLLFVVGLVQYGNLYLLGFLPILTLIFDCGFYMVLPVIFGCFIGAEFAMFLSLGVCLVVVCLLLGLDLAVWFFVVLVGLRIPGFAVYLSLICLVFVFGCAMMFGHLGWGGFFLVCFRGKFVV